MTITIADLGFILGKWEGAGLAEYPTMASVDYDEGLVFTRNDRDPVIHYEQRTWIKSSDENNGHPVFWESGFIIDKGEGLFELVSAQKSGRVEILRGESKNADGGGIEISFNSVSILNDVRLLKSGRRFRFMENVIDYELQMSTTQNPSYDRHLRARLKRPGL
jgi:THAP4-like, heme-binding beta-barrel domain